MGDPVTAFLKHQAKRMVQRTQSQAATRSTAKAAQGSS